MLTLHSCAAFSTVRLTFLRAAVLTSLLTLGGCSATDASALPDVSTDGGANAPFATAPPADGGTVDSIIPLPEALRRFKADLPPVHALAGGAPSREALIARFVEALKHQDTTAVRALVLDRAEFAYLYYPSSVHSAPPRALAPSLAWFLIQQQSEKGITRSFRRLGGLSLQADSLACAEGPHQEGQSSLWSNCTVALRLDAKGSAERHRLFGSIIERDGRFKFVSYANQF